MTEDVPHPPLPQSIRAAVRARYGVDHVHRDFVPSTTALVVIDMQKAFLRPEFGYVPCAAARAAIPTINQLVAAFRRLGQPVFWLQNIHDEEIRESWTGMYAMHGEHASRARALALAQDAPGFSLDDDLDVDLSDQILVKRRYSAFFPGSSELDRELKSRCIETLVLTGTTTDVCVESTARDAMMHDYRVVVVEDATGALSDQSHHNALAAMAMHFADVMPARMVLDRLKDTNPA